ncbi:DUF3800 domain-containing protein [Mycobacterium heidelbergense]|uniref:DUF3800 domain-containing protein n=1 Tax=Mycobacterium heidelbergense TaxID=53376 RepID=UPI00114F9437|nr:DUF3800 domain-containing protein [Mycobacterium heidelbergense]
MRSSAPTATTTGYFVSPQEVEPLAKPEVDAVLVPRGYPCATFFVDESSARASSGSFFVVGAVKLRKPGALLRSIEHIRDTRAYDGEFKFSRISRGKLTAYYEVIDALANSDAHITACVVDLSSKTCNPFDGKHPEWQVHAKVVAKMLVGSINSRELASAVLDRRTTPVGIAFDDAVRGMVNQRLRSTGLVSAVCADSRCTDGLQLADLVAGAVAHQRRSDSSANSHKGRVAARLAAAFGVASFATDQRTKRVNVLTHGSRRTSSHAAVVEQRCPAR